jgi:tetratricopeptide (TPR) repeat protein
MNEKNKKLNQLLDNENWKEARNLLKKWLKIEPNDHWLLTRLSLTYYEDRNYKEALKYAKKANSLNPNCPLVLWDLACALYGKNKYYEAIKIWKKIISKGENKIAYGICSEGKKWAQSLINDSIYRIGFSYKKLGKYSIAINYYNKYITNREYAKSIYNLRSVKKELKEMKLKK